MPPHFNALMKQAHYISLIAPADEQEKRRDH